MIQFVSTTGRMAIWWFSQNDIAQRRALTGLGKRELGTSSLKDKGAGRLQQDMLGADKRF